MIEKIIDSVIAILRAEYPDYPVYTERVEQGLETPCFFVYSLMMSLRRYVGQRVNEQYSLVVQYLPGSDEPRAECATVEENLYLLLEDVPIDGAPIHSEEIRSETTDEVLTLYPVYAFHTQREDESDEPMTHYELKGLYPDG